MKRSILAVLAGLGFIFVTHTVMDVLFESMGWMPARGEPLTDAGLMWASAYRAIFSILGCYITARLAPANPMRHALILGGIGVVLSSLGAIAMWDLGHVWYPLSLIILTLPYAWLGGYLYTRKRS
ncbi:MAG: hypothetical protein HOO97_07925 [Sideroxydans sp.]|nr:hypothetical protein [Sideroxydans sp.]